MQRGISYEEIFATPRYDQLCQACFDKLLRLKPELQKAASSCAEEQLTSNGSTPMHRRQLSTLPELSDNFENILMLPERPRMQRNASTQTQGCSVSSSTNNFLSQIEKFNFSEESTNVNYSPGLMNSDISVTGLIVEPATSSAGASATSVAPQRIYHTEQADITEVWSFGRWLEPQDKMIVSNAYEFVQQPLTEHRITLEVKQHFPTGQLDRQLMSREERQRRKSEFQELWQDHVEYFGAKEQMQQQQQQQQQQHTLETLTLDEQEEQSLRAHDWMDQDLELMQGDPKDPELDAEAYNEHSKNSQDETLTESSYELPKVLQKFEESLTLAGENLEKLVATAKKLQALDTTDTSAVTTSSSPVERDPVEGSCLFRSISLENIPNADDTVCIQEPEVVGSINSSNSNHSEVEIVHGIPINLEQEEKRDDEKPVTPSSTEPEESTDKEKERDDEKDIDENDLEVEAEIQEITGETPEVSNVDPDSDNQIFTPLEREVLQRIEDDRLDEREPIFGKIDQSIRNKMTPKKLQDLVSEEIFCTRTLIYPSNPSTPLPKVALADTTLTPSGSSLSAHNISAPCSSMAHTHLTTRPTPRMSRSWSADEQRDEENNDEEELVITEEETPLDRIISSTTFVCRSSPRRKRNFIQENIRNASRPRSNVGAVKKHRSTPVTSPRTISNPSSVCAFQCGQRDSGARLWVSMPTPPRRASGQKRGSTTSPAHALYSVRGGLSSPFAKRRKPMVILPPLRGGNCLQSPNLNSSFLSLHRTLSSSTFFVRGEENGESDNISTSTFQMDGSQEEQEKQEGEEDNRNPKESPAAHDPANATNSSVYYSANDNTREETESSQTSTETAEENAGSAMLTKTPFLPETSITNTIYASSSDKSLDIPMKTNYQTEDLCSQKNKMELSRVSQDITDPEVSSQLVDTASSAEFTRLAGGSERQQFSTSTIEIEHREEGESPSEQKIKHKSSQSSSSFENVLSSANELNRMPRKNDEYDSSDDYDDEKLIRVIKATDEDMDMDMVVVINDDEPTTSKAAVTKNRQSGGAETKHNSSTEDEDVVILDTVCTVHGLEMFVREAEPKLQANLSFDSLPNFLDKSFEEDEEAHARESVEPEIVQESTETD
ncbi:hypothetical protein M5D96_010225 [Drosophila gunungcola]|uniref:Ig-like domain-containing protein n=2 Tax=Drosophila gunungcola TaxID=103775 RepID=A0A9P9YHY3_9MUSC|nr:hypothetical protein M5D96_010225 [Drosophila gunungcola]